MDQDHWVQIEMEISVRAHVIEARGVILTATVLVVIALTSGSLHLHLEDARLLQVVYYRDASINLAN